MTVPHTESINLVLSDKQDDKRLNVYDLSPASLTELMVSWGEPAYRASQVLHWLYKEYAADFAHMSNLPVSLRNRLDASLRVGSIETVAQKISSDGWTRKALLKMRDGNTVEAVLMLYYDRATVCVSSQVGCAMGCTFCATGQMGFTRNLSAGEIVEQVIHFNRWLREHPHTVTGEPGHKHEGARHHAKAVRHPEALTEDADVWFGKYQGVSGEPRSISALTNIVFMGMGEPLVNYGNLWTAIRTINSPQGLGMGARRMTVSTVGLVPGIRRFAKEDLPVNLAVSLHAPNDVLRGSFMPINDKYPVSDLLAACREYVATARRRISFEYVLINGVNDQISMAEELRDRLRGLLCHVNLIPLNPVPGTGMKATPRAQVYAFQKVLEVAGIHTTVRIERGVDIAAACGQLKVEEEPGSKHRSLNPELVQAHVLANLASQGNDAD
ncbi:MAG TPA: 23S rRNA (adenine(2503)-C2)-methyltransferase [Chloroflexia bacterium]|nr:23S rRNA (adenine(2503)-C2)-methyltransferase [Chloroflexia bacterium]